MDSQELRNLQEAYLEVYQPLDEAIIVKRGTSTNAAGQQIPWTHRHNTVTGRSTVKDKFGERDVTVPSVKMDKTQSAKKSRMQEQVDLYDIILSHLLDEGYASTEESAEVIMVNMSEEWREDIVELYQGRHGQSETQYQDSRSNAGKMVSGTSKLSGAAYSSRGVKNTGPNPAGGSTRPQGQGRMTSGQRAEMQYRKANLKKG